MASAWMVVAWCCGQNRKKVHSPHSSGNSSPRTNTPPSWKTPTSSTRYNRKNDFFDEAMGAIFGVKGAAELQSFCFQPSKFTPARAEPSRGGTTQ